CHEVHCANRMMKAGVQCAGIYQVAEAKLHDPTQTLKIGVFDQVENNIIRN
ncbi:MAG: hypothetical protein RIT43_1662, partial [Bacteroidota bacterium]